MIYTPLRYPGGKAKFAPTIKKIIEENNLNAHYVEPYAGGAGVALDLLFNNYCTDIHINDLDLAIYHFWKAITEQTDEFIQLVVSTSITINEWSRQKELIKRTDISPLEHGFAFFFLNRTNRSGIIEAGMIGGKNQFGKYKINDRFNKINLIKRIERIGEMHQKIHITNFDTKAWLPIIDKIIPKNSLIYLDPPYYEKGKFLYRNFYQHEDHLAIKEKLTNIKTDWIVSYDNNINIKDIYQQYRQREYSLNYSANKKIKATKILTKSRL